MRSRVDTHKSDEYLPSPSTSEGTSMRGVTKNSPGSSIRLSQILMVVLLGTSSMCVWAGGLAPISPSLLHTDPPTTEQQAVSAGEPQASTCVLYSQIRDLIGQSAFSALPPALRQRLVDRIARKADFTGPLPMFCFAPGTPVEVIQAFEQTRRKTDKYRLMSDAWPRWGLTATNRQETSSPMPAVAAESQTRYTRPGDSNKPASMRSWFNRTGRPSGPWRSTCQPITCNGPASRVHSRQTPPPGAATARMETAGDKGDWAKARTAVVWSQIQIPKANLPIRAPAMGRRSVIPEFT